MIARCDASADAAQRTKCSGMRVRDWVAGGRCHIKSQLHTNKETIWLRPTMLNMFLVRKWMDVFWPFLCGWSGDRQLQRSGQNNMRQKYPVWFKNTNLKEKAFKLYVIMEGVSLIYIPLFSVTVCIWRILDYMPFCWNSTTASQLPLQNVHLYWAGLSPSLLKDRFVFFQDHLKTIFPHPYVHSQGFRSLS